LTLSGSFLITSGQSRVAVHQTGTFPHPNPKTCQTSWEGLNTLQCTLPGQNCPGKA